MGIGGAQRVWFLCPQRIQVGITPGDKIGKVKPPVIKYNPRTHASFGNILNRDRKAAEGCIAGCQIRRRCARSHKICMWEPQADGGERDRLGFGTEGRMPKPTLFRLERGRLRWEEAGCRVPCGPLLRTGQTLSP